MSTPPCTTLLSASPRFRVAFPRRKRNSSRNFKMTMHVLRGAPAFTPARLAKRLGRIQKRNPSIRDAAAEFVHFADIVAPLSGDEMRVLDRLLHYGPRVKEHRLDGRALLVVPRLGTISPWSSKATDIAHNCGLDKVRRIERGI